MNLYRRWLAYFALGLAAAGVFATSDPSDFEHDYPTMQELRPSPGVVHALDDCELDDTCGDFRYPTLDTDDQ